MNGVAHKTYLVIVASDYASILQGGQRNYFLIEYYNIVTNVYGYRFRILKERNMNAEMSHYQGI